MHPCSPGTTIADPRAPNSTRELTLALVTIGLALMRIICFPDPCSSVVIFSRTAPSGPPSTLMSQSSKLPPRQVTTFFAAKAPSMSVRRSGMLRHCSLQIDHDRGRGNAAAPRECRNLHGVSPLDRRPSNRAAGCTRYNHQITNRRRQTSVRGMKPSFRICRIAVAPARSGIAVATINSGTITSNGCQAILIADIPPRIMMIKYHSGVCGSAANVPPRVR